MRRYLVCVFAVILLAIPGVAATLGQTDTFQNLTTDNWFAGGLGTGSVPPVPPHVVATGGPAGAGDAFLQITAGGGDGPGSKLVAINAAQWAGNYLTAGISGIAMDLKNLGATPLDIRLLVEDPMMAPPLDEAVSTVGFVLPAGSGWQRAFFPLSPTSFTAVMGSVNAALGHATLLRIIHSTTAGDAEAVVGALGVDNITAVPEPSTLLLLAAGLGAIAVGRKKRA
jgi:PEP-CTERM motif-containing protein